MSRWKSFIKEEGLQCSLKVNSLCLSYLPGNLFFPQIPSSEETESVKNGFVYFLQMWDQWVLAVDKSIVLLSVVSEWLRSHRSLNEGVEQQVSEGNACGKRPPVIWLVVMYPILCVHPVVNIRTQIMSVWPCDQKGQSLRLKG